MLESGIIIELSWLILIILAVIYVPFYIWVRISPKAEKYGLRKYGPCVMVRTQLGKKTMDKYAKYKRFWRAFGILSQIIALALMITIVYVMFSSMYHLATGMKTGGLGVEYALAIPGLNPLLPLWYGALGLLVSMVLHELAHGFQTRANGMRVDSTGLLHAVVPMGAFVEPNEEDVSKSSRQAKLDLYSAGISANFITALVTFTLFAGVMLGGISSPYGDDAATYAVSADSASYNVGIPAGAIIDKIDGEKFVYNPSGYTPTYSWKPGDMVSVTYITASGSHLSEKMRWGVYLEKVHDKTPAAGVLYKGEYLCSATVSGSTDTKQLYTAGDFTRFLSEITPGETVVFKCVTKDGTIEDRTIKTADKNSKAFVGVSSNTSGMMFTTPNATLEKGKNPFTGATSFTDYATAALKYVSGPFQGYSPLPESTHWWYEAPLGALFWVLVSVLYWIFWLSVMLGISNAIPAIPFDGGYIFMGWLDALMQRTGMKDEEKRRIKTEKITQSVSMVMIAMFIIVILATVL